MSPEPAHEWFDASQYVIEVGETDNEAEALAERLYEVLSDQGVVRIHADSPKELADIARAILGDHGLFLEDARDFIITLSGGPQ